MKNILLYRNKNRVHNLRRPVPAEGRFAIVTIRWARDAMDAVASGDLITGRKRRSVRRSRVVLAPRPGRYVGGKYPAGNGGKKGRSPGRARISRKTIARGKPGCPGCTCSLTRVHFCSTLRTRDYGRSRRPAFPAPSSQERDNEIARLGRIPAARMRELGCLKIESERDEATLYPLVMPGACPGHPRLDFL